MCIKISLEGRGYEHSGCNHGLLATQKTFVSLRFWSKTFVSLRFWSKTLVTLRFWSKTPPLPLPLRGGDMNTLGVITASWRSDAGKRRPLNEHHPLAFGRAQDPPLQLRGKCSQSQISILKSQISIQTQISNLNSQFSIFNFQSSIYFTHARGGSSRGRCRWPR